MSVNRRQKADDREQRLSIADLGLFRLGILDFGFRIDWIATLSCGSFDFGLGMFSIWDMEFWILDCRGF